MGTPKTNGTPVGILFTPDEVLPVLNHLSFQEGASLGEEGGEGGRGVYYVVRRARVLNSGSEKNDGVVRRRQPIISGRHIKNKSSSVLDRSNTLTPTARFLLHAGEKQALLEENESPPPHCFTGTSRLLLMNQ